MLGATVFGKLGLLKIITVNRMYRIQSRVDMVDSGHGNRPRNTKTISFFYYIPRRDGQNDHIFQNDLVFIIFC